MSRRFPDKQEMHRSRGTRSPRNARCQGRSGRSVDKFRAAGEPACHGLVEDWASMTAMIVTASVTGGQSVFWRPSAALRVAHKPIRNRRLAASLLAVICALTLLLGLAGPASASTAPDTETAVAAQTGPATVFVGLQTPETPATVGPNGSYAYDGSLGCCVAPSRPLGFAPGAADSALSNVGRVDHASIHLIDEGLITGSKGSTVARNGFRDAARPILENPLQTFDHVMARSGQAVRGFVGEINGQQVVIFVAKAPNGKIAAGDIVTSVVPTPQQALNWGIN